MVYSTIRITGETKKVLDRIKLQLAEENPSILNDITYEIVIQTIIKELKKYEGL
jgi:hypothetical protein